jgi:amino acid adenylation domain-containing protein
MMFEKYILTPVRKSIANNTDRNAFYIDGTYYSYRQFAERVSAIRNVIRAAEKDEQIWGLSLHDDLNTYASIFALWMEGKAYVPLHPSWPEERIASIKEQVGCSNVLDACDASYTEDLLDDWAEASEDDLAYILFTSGSTGVPKGVQLTRRNIAAFMDSFWKTGIDITPDDRCMQVFDLTFDVSVQSYLVALTRGACVYTVPYGQVKYLYAASLIQEQGITFGAMAPSMLTYLRPYFEEFEASSMKACILTAEACPVDLMEAWYGCAKNTEIYDFYGPTEATIYCTYYKLTRGGENLILNGIISIGKPLANVQAIIIREDGCLVEGQEKGELCVAGDQVTPGYWKNEEKNSSSFFMRDGVRYYHTGDLCYWHESGNIMYSGRIDQQAKIQGFRVELGEIEHHARTFYENERRVIAIAFQNDKNLTEIGLFIEAHEEDSAELIAYLRTKMPSYMIPTRYIYEPVFPLNKSEKVDRNALRERLK